MDDVQDILAIDLIGIVPEDSAIVAASNRGEPAALSETSRAGKAYREIAQRLHRRGRAARPARGE